MLYRGLIYILYIHVDSVLSVLLNQKLDLNLFLSKCIDSNSSGVYRESVENILMIFKNLLTAVKKDMANYLAKIMGNFYIDSFYYIIISK